VLGTPLWQETNPMFLCRLLVSEIHWVVWASTFGNEATIGYLCHAEIISMAWSPWKNSFVLSHSQRIFLWAPWQIASPRLWARPHPWGAVGCHPMCRKAPDICIHRYTRVIWSMLESYAHGERWWVMHFGLLKIAKHFHWMVDFLWVDPHLSCVLLLRVSFVFSTTVFFFPYFN